MCSQTVLPSIVSGCTAHANDQVTEVVVDKERQDASLIYKGLEHEAERNLSRGY